ncbi:MAG TPA: four helix bundle protein [Gemmatimonadales bacterium]|nr:four helix bundle protein [Gemmatimonadales bacterium]
MCIEWGSPQFLSMVRSYRDLIVWQRAMQLAEAAYVVSRALPMEERYGLASLLQRAAVSVAANIAEGHGRVHRREYAHHLSIAVGAVAEIETLLLLASRLHVLPTPPMERATALADETGRMLTTIIQRLKRRSPHP